MDKLTTTVTAVAGALTTLAAFVVIPGSAAMLVRLERAKLPPDLGVVTTLPDQFLIAFGLAYVVLPLLVLVALSLVVTWLPGERGKQNPTLARWGEWAGWTLRWLFSRHDRRPPTKPQEAPHTGRSVLLVAFGLLVALGLPIAVFGFWPPDWAWWYLASVATAIGLLAGAAFIARACEKRRELAFGWLALLAALVFVGWTVAFAGVRAEFPQTTVCLKEGRLDGVLISRTDDSYYVGEPEKRVALLGVGPSAEELAAEASDPVAAAANQHATQVKANVTGGLRAGGYGVIDVAQEGDVTYQRTALVIADSADGSEQLRLPLDLGLPVLVIGAEDGFAEGAEGISEEDSRRPSVLNERVEQLLEADQEVPDVDRPQRRIATVPASEVTGYRLGAAGPCPVSDG